MLSGKKKTESWPDSVLLETMHNKVLHRLKSRRYSVKSNKPSKTEFAKKMRKISEDKHSWDSGVTLEENLEDLEIWAEEQLVKEGQARKQKNVMRGPILKYPNALTWVTAYDKTLNRIAEQLRECLFERKTAPFDWQEFKNKNVQRARSKAIQWVKDTIKEESGDFLTFECEQWTALGCDVAWFDRYRKASKLPLPKWCDEILFNDGFETFTNSERKSGVTVLLYDPNGWLYAEKVRHGGKLAWFVKWSNYLARCSGWWSDSDAMSFVLTNMPAMISSPVTGSVVSPNHGASLCIPGTQDGSFVPEKIVLTIHSPASEDEVIAEYRRIMQFHQFKRRKLSATGQALLELCFQMPSATWLQRLKKWEQWRLQHPELTEFKAPDAVKAMREEWKRATKSAFWNPNQKKPSASISSLPTIEALETKLVLDDD